MGIPTFFRSIIANNRRVISGVVPGSLSVDCFFMDFNSIIYKEWADIPREEKESKTGATLEGLLVEKVLRRTQSLVNEVVRPRDYAYISMDGPAPRAKMIQQRSRRHKSVQGGRLLEEARKRLGGTVSRVDWDPSCHICPGTRFMDRLSRGLQKTMATGGFVASVLLSDGNNPGEGEHKILPRIRAMISDPSEQDKTVVIYSPDGDMISLGLLTRKTKIHIMRFVDPQNEQERPLQDKGFEFLYLSLDIVREDFFRKLTQTFPNVDENRVLLDYNFLLAMVGNDFVPSLPFLKIRSGGLDTLIDIYNRLRPRFDDYLVSPIPSVHTAFFRELIVELAKIETGEMRKEYAQLEKEYHGQDNARRSCRERQMTPYQVFESRFYHMPMFHPDHPLAAEYRPLFGRIDFRQEKHVWKGAFYRHFCGWDPFHFSSYNNGRADLVKNYLESLMFTLHYYIKGCPSWIWHYRYRVAPLPSDIFTALDRFRMDVNRIRFDRGRPYTPFQQLMLILPRQNMGILPDGFRELALSDKWSSFYPETFRVDALGGFKYIYSEAILPDWDAEAESEFLREIRLLEASLDEKDQRRNRVSTTIKKSLKKK